jgi:hypothetical protein
MASASGQRPARRQTFSETETCGRHTVMPRTTTHAPGGLRVGDGDGEGDGGGDGDGPGEGPGRVRVGDGDGDGPGDGAGVVGLGPPGEVGAGVGDPDAAGWPGPGESLDTATGWTWRRCGERPPGCWPRGWAVLGPPGRPAADGGCERGADVMKIPAADAPTTVAVVAAPQATGRVATMRPTRPSSARIPRTRPIPTGSSPVRRQPARREARSASMMAARCCLASSPADT